MTNCQVLSLNICPAQKYFKFYLYKVSQHIKQHKTFDTTGNLQITN